MMKKLLAILLSMVLLLSLAACVAEDIAPAPKGDGDEEDIVPDLPKEEEKDDGKEELSFVFASSYSYGWNEVDIEKDLILFHTKQDLDAFVAEYGEQLVGERFAQDVLKYDDAFFEKNTLIWWLYGVISDNEYEITSIDHVKISDSYVINHVVRYPMYSSGQMVGFQYCFIEIEGKHAMTEENTTVNVTEVFYSFD